MAKYSTAWIHMYIGHGFHEVDARAVHAFCPCVHLKRNKRSTRRNLGKRILQWPCLRALNCLCLLFVVFYCLLSGRIYPRGFHGNHSHLLRSHRCIADGLSYRHLRSKRTLMAMHTMLVYKAVTKYVTLFYELLSTIKQQQQQAENRNGKCSLCAFKRYQNNAKYSVTLKGMVKQKFAL